MARCEDIKLLLGPFEDGELEPHEMQEVARHLASCAECEGELADYGSLAVSLRGAAVLPDLTGFTNAVLARVDGLPIPIGARIRRYFTSFTDGIGATIATGFAAAAVAVVTAVILTPYFKHARFDFLSTPQQVASTLPSAPAAAPRPVPGSDSIPPDVANGISNPDAFGDNGGAIRPVEASSGTIIDRLEADSPSVAVWSEPQSDTTVIWVPDQSR
jgi:anti-sigma factor RsiW